MDDELEKKLDKLLGLKGAELEQAKKLLGAQKDSIPVTRKLREERIKELGDLRKKAKGDKELLALIDGQINRIKNINKAYDDQLNAIKKSVGSIWGFGKAAAAGEGSISSFTDNLKGFNAITDSIVNLGNRLDTNIETFRGLAETGASFGQSIVELRRASAEAALPLDDFAALVRDNAVNLAALFGSTTEGAKRVAQLAAGFREANINALAPLGFTIDEINETLLQNLERQRRTFNFQGRADEANMASAFAYAQQLDRLAKLTGVQRRELQAQIDAQMSNERFQAMLAGQTRETGQRLETFAGTIGAISPELAEGFQDLIANAGVPVTEAALSLVQNMPEARFAVQNLISGLTTAEEALVSVRDASVRSQDRFRQATVTGQVEFLRLQGGIIKLGATALDVNAVMAEQAKITPRLTQGLTTFQNATKVLASQFQRIETELLAAFGPMLGGITQMTQGVMDQIGKMVGMVAQIPALTAPLVLGGIIGKYLFDKVSQIGIIAAGVKLGIGGFKGMFQNWRGKGPGGPTGGAPIQGAGVNRGVFAGGLGLGKGGIGSKLLRGGGLVGAGLGGIAAVGQLMDKDKKNDAGAIGTLIGTGLGIFGGPLGMMLGGMAGGALGSMFGGGRALGTMGATGKPFEPATANMLVHKGERVLDTEEAKTVNKLEQGITFAPLLESMTALITENKIQNKQLNTLVALGGEELKVAKRGVSLQNNTTSTLLTT